MTEVATDKGYAAACHRLAIAALIIVLAWAGLLRFVGITHSRLLLCDESYYLMEAKRIVGQVHACEAIAEIWRRDHPPGLIPLPASDRERIESLANDGYGQIGGRFGHDLLLAVGLLCGLPLEWGGQAIAAFFGLATVLFVAGWTGFMWGLRSGVLAAAVLGGSVVHLTYSRSVLCESDALFFLTTSFIAYAVALKAQRVGVRTACVIAAGFSFGLAFVCNMRAIPVLYGFVVFEAMSLTPCISAKRLALFTVGAVLPPFLAEMLFHVVFLFSGATGVLLTRQTYIHSLLWQFSRLHGGVMAPGTNVGQYIRYLVALENPVLLVLYLAGTVLVGYRAAGRGRESERLLLTVTLVVFGYWEAAVSLKCLRYISEAAPFLAMLAAQASAQIEHVAAVHWPKRAIVAWLALVLVCVASSSLTWRRWQEEPPGYQEVAAWLVARSPCRIVATQPNYFRLYFSTADVGIAETIEQLKDLHSRGFRWYVDCFQKYQSPARVSLLAIQAFLLRVEPIRFPHPRANTPFNWYECGITDVPAEWAADASVIKVWDLDAVLGPAPHPPTGL